MFVLTDDETTALENATKFQAVFQEKNQAVRRLGYGTTEEDRAKATAEYNEAKAASDEAQTTEAALIAILKNEANKLIAEKLPGGSYGAILALAEQTMGLLDTESGLRTTGLIRDGILRLLRAGADKEIHVARAQIVKTRYDALIEVGLPADLVREIIIAEASVPWQFPSASATSRK